MLRQLFISPLLIIGLAACGSDKTTENDDTSAADENAVASKSTPKSDKSASLTMTPISFADATGENSEMVEVGPCPFLSDETAKASVRTSSEISRREVSNSLCRWAYNAGFAIEVTIEDLASARPIKERLYNIGVETVIEPQDGPGTNAAVINDTAWNKNIPFAYSFEKDGKLIFIRYTGFKTNPEIMRPAAVEIARRMSTAPKIEPQRRHLTEPFKPCDVWTNEDLKTAFGAGDTATIAPGARGIHSCSWKIYEDGKAGSRSAALNIYKSKSGEKAPYEYEGHETYSANNETHYLRKAPSNFGLFVHVITPRPEGLVYVTVSDPERDPTSVAKKLQNNLLSRMVP